MRQILDARTNPEIHTDHIVDLAELLLKNNNFESDGKHFLQKRGTALVRGWRLPVLESRLLVLAPVKPYVWLRYIDDIFMIWTVGEDSLLEFIQGMNQYHDTIKFTWDWSRQNISYLDVQVIDNNGVIERICKLTQLISISIYFIPHVIQGGLNEVFHMHKLLGLNVFVLRLLLLSIGQLILGNF